MCKDLLGKGNFKSRKNNALSSAVETPLNSRVAQCRSSFGKERQSPLPVPSTVHRAARSPSAVLPNTLLLSLTNKTQTPIPFSLVSRNKMKSVRDCSSIYLLSVLPALRKHRNYSREDFPPACFVTLQCVGNLQSSVSASSGSFKAAEFWRTVHGILQKTSDYRI